jgi:hypothetical protein
LFLPPLPSKISFSFGAKQVFGRVSIMSKIYKCKRNRKH